MAILQKHKVYPDIEKWETLRLQRVKLENWSIDVVHGVSPSLRLSGKNHLYDLFLRR